MFGDYTSGAGPLVWTVRRHSALMRLRHVIATLLLLSACKSAHVTGYLTPAHLVGQIRPSDRIFVTSTFAGLQGQPSYPTFTTTITGIEVRTIIDAISSLRAATYDVPTVGNGCLCRWQLKFYRGTEHLGTVDLAIVWLNATGWSMKIRRP